MSRQSPRRPPIADMQIRAQNHRRISSLRSIHSHATMPVCILLLLLLMFVGGMGTDAAPTCPILSGGGMDLGMGMQPCPAGTYSVGNASASTCTCAPCPAGYACADPSSITPEPCPLGSFSTASSSQCTPCPSGFKCPLTTQPPSSTDLCPLGTYSLGNATECTICPRGMACPFNHLPPSIQCPLGTYAPEGSPSCEPCRSGYFCPNATVELPCPDGLYSIGGATECSLCPAGYTCLPPGSATDPTLCPAGTYSRVGDSACTSCGAGYYCPVDGMNEPQPPGFICPPGSYCPPNSITPTPCPLGTYGPTSNASTAQECLDCPAGFFCAQGTSNFQRNVCPPGYTCPTGTPANAIDGTLPAPSARCPAGTFNPNLGGANSSDCLACVAGYYCPLGSSELSDCPAGFYCPDGTQDVCYAGSNTCDVSPPQPCPPGSYSPTPGLIYRTQCLECPAGSYCPAGTIYPVACPPGTFNPTFNATDLANCQLCPAGMSCPLSGLTSPGANCSTGHYCPAGTAFASDMPCPPGTYTDSLYASMESDCLPCPEGFTCGYGTGGSQQPPVICPAGYYCPTSSPSATACPPGTYSPAEGNKRMDDCLACDAGSYCLGTGETTVSGLCDAGHYCPPRTPTATSNPCPAGTYNPNAGLSRIDQCLPCPNGTWCGLGSATPTPCMAGYFNPFTSQTSLSACQQCTAGYTCPDQGMDEPQECGAGHYSSSRSSVVSCSVCQAGHYCPSATTTQTQMQANECPAGAACPAGLDHVPDFAQFECPTGQYCPAGSGPTGTDCDAGTYQPNRGGKMQGDCLQCPPGQYCTGGGTWPSGNCSAGYYCTGGSSTPTQYACPAGRYRSVVGGESLDGCAWCPGGYYCPTPGLPDPIICPQGKYCLPGVTIGSDCPKGTYGNTTGLQSVALCSNCDAGYYCATLGLTKPTGPCDAGYYCTVGANNSMAAGQPAVGGLCPIGGYCEEGSTKSAPCPPGTYGAHLGLRMASECSPCSPGYYCQGSNLNNVTGPCAPGYYCEGGSKFAQPPEGLCPEGYYCPGGTGYPVPCPPGHYMVAKGADACTPCDAGYYCPTSNATKSIPCPLGSYCPAGMSTPILCPAGTFGEHELLTSEAGCTSCPPGAYCLGGATLPQGCDSGRYCPGNITNANGIPCPAGTYCVANSSQPQPCGAGYFSPLIQQTSVAACTPCTAGKYCSLSINTAPTGDCSEGFYCPLASTSPTGAGPCPHNTYCPTGSPAPLNCLPGTYSNTTGRVSCDDCPKGFYCPGATSITICPQGAYCPSNGATVPPSTLCPPGTYGSQLGLVSVDQCSVCPAGWYCAGSGNTAPTGQCQAGFLCASGPDQTDGAVTARGQTISSSADVPCPTGHYCPAGSLAQKCPIGTFLDSTGAPSITSCIGCTPGYYCGDSGLSAVSGPCNAGWYCGANATSPMPNTGDAIFLPAITSNGRCQPGYCCPQGSDAPKLCAAGSYSDDVGAATCDPCPSGYYCLEGATNGMEHECPAGSYCAGSTPSPGFSLCPTGRYSSQLGLQSADDCTLCEPGKYCGSEGLTSPSGSCYGGYQCYGGSPTPTPTDPSHGRLCPAGSVCTNGTTSPEPCSINYWCAAGQAEPSGLCSAGYYCLEGSSSPTSLNCPAGYFCLGDVNGSQPCPPGRYSDTQNAATNVCQQCQAGYYCPSAHMTSGDMIPCPSGRVCPLGSMDANTLCPIGHRCPGETAAALPCGPGTYQDQPSQTYCKQTPAGYYTSNTTNTHPVICSTGSYCPDGTNSSTQFTCPPGTYNDGVGKTSVDQCALCQPGFYCDSWGATTGSDPAKQCAPGYYCVQGANTSQPTDGITGNICPYGAYCPPQSSIPTPCNEGTLAPSKGNDDISDCTACPVGQYCSATLSPGATIPLCSAGYWCKGSAKVATPTDGVTGIACTPGTYCPAGATNLTLCPPGTYNPDYARGACYNCPAGSACPDSGMTTTDTCPVGRYCAGNDTVGLPCPPGRYSQTPGLSSSDACTSCSAGLYCDGSNSSQQTGECEAGYICVGGSSSPMPTGVYPSSGPCPAGHYCPRGTVAPLQCPQGTFRPVSGASNVTGCSPCTPGSYCATEGLVNPSAPCTAGFYCPLGTKQPTLPCPVGHYCPTGSALPLPCPDASYNSQQGRSTCLACHAGYTCTNGSAVPAQAPCPIGHYCLSGETPLPCMPGTYGHRPGLQNQTECAICPPGVYCSGSGFITGNCSAGYLCKAGNVIQSPLGPLDQPGSMTNGGPCPIGYYCPAGTLFPVMCPTGTARVETGGMMASDCGPCPERYMCLENVPVPCPAGFYCPANNTGAIPCPLGTYGPNASQADLGGCEACPGGFRCTQYNMSSYDQSPCPVGSYCPPASQIIHPCPAGTYRSVISGAQPSDCSVCPAGYACPAGSSAPEPCPPGSYCTEGSGEPGPCPSGYWCGADVLDPDRTAPPVPCRAGYYCPINSSVEVVCTSPYYCPAMSAAPLTCPLGFYNITSPGLHTSVEDSCSMCPAGTYSINPNLPICHPCTPGYVCLGGTNTSTPIHEVYDRGYRCLIGHYCPEGSYEPIPCPAGTYASEEGGAALEDCLPCPANSFSALDGSGKCIPCGSSAYALPGSTACLCNGTYRAYQLSDGSCKCKPGYEFFDQMNELYDGDSPFDCQPIVFGSCLGEDRDSQGRCVSDKQEACAQACAGSSLRLANAVCDPSMLTQPDGLFDPSTQVCTCANVPPLTYCNSTCMASLPSMRIDANGIWNVLDVATGTGAQLTTTQIHTNYGLFAPQLDCRSSSGCAMSSIVASPFGHRALLGLPPTIAGLASVPLQSSSACNYSGTLNPDGSFSPMSLSKEESMQTWHVQMDSTQKSSRSSRYTLLSSVSHSFSSFMGSPSRPSDSDLSSSSHSFHPLSTPPNPFPIAPSLDYLETLRGYYNPTLCLQAGESVFWELDSAAHYPVYQKDNFLNSNQDFDYGVFEQLADQLAVGAGIKTFAFTFREEGTYVFADAANDQHLTIIAVLPLSQPCPNGYRVLPTSATSLNPLGVGRIVTPYTEPDLTLVWALFGMFMGMSVIVAIVSKLKQRRTLRALELRQEDDTQARNDFKQLYLEIRDQKSAHKAMFSHQRDHFRAECDRICAETEQVKALLATKMTDGRGFVDAAINLLLQEITARNSYGTRQKRRENDLMAQLTTLQRMMEDATDYDPTDRESSPPPLPVADIQSQVETVGSRLNDVIGECEKERTRKRHLQNNAGIIGDEIVAKLNEHAYVEEGAEGAFLDKLRTFKQQCADYHATVQELETELDEKVNVLRARRNHAAIESAQAKFERRVRDLVDSLAIDLDRLLNSVDGVHEELKEAREQTVEDENEALEALEQRKLDVEATMQTGIFRDLDDELAEAIRFFLGQARRELLPLQPAFDQAMMSAGGMMMSRGFVQGETSTGGGGSGVAPSYSYSLQQQQQEQQQTGGPGPSAGMVGGLGPGAAQPGVDPSTTSGQPAKESATAGDLVEQAAADLSAAMEDASEKARRAMLEHVEDMSVAELRRLYDGLKQREEMMAQLQRAEEERQKKLAAELLRSADMEPEEEVMLGRARQMLDSMVDKHRREEEALQAQLKSDEEVRINAEIAALSKVEESVERKKAELEKEMARRNELAASESEKTEIAHEHQVQLRSLEESLRQDKLNSQKALSKIHDDMRAKLRAAKAEMRAKQKKAEAPVRQEYETVKETVERRMDERGVKVEGVDLRAVERALHDPANMKPSAKQHALAAFHIQTQQEMAKKHQADERKLAEESERERQKELAALEDEYERRKEKELRELEARLKSERASLNDEDQAKALLLQHSNQLKQLSTELDAEKSRQKVHLNQALAKRRKMKEAALKQQHVLEAEKEALEQKAELAAISKADQRKREFVALTPLLTDENHRKAKAVIERLIRPRQHKEMSALIQANFKESALLLEQNIERAMERAATQREDVERKVRMGELTPAEADLEYERIDRDLDPCAIKKATLQYLEPLQNDALTLQKRSHFQEVKEAMMKFYPNEDFTGAEWKMEEQIVNVAAIMKEAEERKKKAEAELEEKMRELKRKEEEQKAELERLKTEKLAEVEATLAAENARLAAEFEERMAAQQAEFESAQRLEQERQHARQMDELARREREIAEKEAAARAAGELEQERAAAAERAALAAEQRLAETELETQQREQQKAAELEAERTRKRFAAKLALRAQDEKLKELQRLEEEHRARMEQEKRNMEMSAQKAREQSEAEEAQRHQLIQAASRAFRRAGREYSERRTIGVKAAIRRIRRLYDRTRAAGQLNFGLVPGPVEGTMLRVPLQPGMRIIGGGGAVVGESGMTPAPAPGASGLAAGTMAAALGTAGLLSSSTAASSIPALAGTIGAPGAMPSAIPAGTTIAGVALGASVGTGAAGAVVGAGSTSAVGVSGGAITPGAGPGAVIVPGVGAGGVGAGSGMSAAALAGMPFPGIGPGGQPFVNKLDSIEAALSKMLQQGPGALLPHMAPGEAALQPPPNATSVEEVRLIDLSPKRFVLYRFGLFILDFLTDLHTMPPVRLLLARSLPARTHDAHRYAENSFQHSFHFDPHSRLLFIRLERMEEVGIFTLLLIHCISHIKAGTWSDNHPTFQQHFQTSIAAICAQLFFARTKKGYSGFKPSSDLSEGVSEEGNGVSAAASESSSSSSLLVPSDGMSYKELQSLFGLVSNAEFREDIVGEFLDLHQIGSHYDEAFSESAMMQRMEQYKQFATAQPLATWMRELEKNTVKTKQDALAKEKATTLASAAAVASSSTDSTTSDGRLGLSRKATVSSSSRKEAASAREKLKGRVDRLLDESDRLHTQLLSVVQSMSSVNERMVSVEETMERMKRGAASSSSSDRSATGLPALQHDHAELHAKLKRLSLQKDSINLRIEQIDEQYQKTMAEIGRIR